MTFFGHDVSAYQSDYQPKAGEFVIIKASEGAHTHDPSWSTLLQRAKDNGAIPLAYHFLHSDSSPAAQAANLASCPGIKGVPIMVDAESEGSSMPDVNTVAAFTDQCRALGLTVKLVYLPKWYWENIGSPSLQPLISRGLYLVSSAYPGGSGYPGDGGSGWNSYGGMTPLIWQYSDQPLDEDAYRGTVAQLKAILGLSIPAPRPPVPTPVPTPKPPVPVSTQSYTVKSGDTMSGIAASHGLSLARLEQLNPQVSNPNLIYPGEVLHLDGGAVVQHASYTVQTGDTLSAIAAAHNTTWQALASINHLSDPNLIFPGQVLRLN